MHGLALSSEDQIECSQMFGTHHVDVLDVGKHLHLMHTHEHMTVVDEASRILIFDNLSLAIQALNPRHM